MAINIVDQFQVNTYLPIDNRFVVGTASMSTTSGTYSPFYLYRDDILYKYPGLRIWDFNDGVPYVWTGLTWSNENTTGALVQNGGGHQNWIPKFINNSTLLGKSLMFDNGANIGLGISTAPSFPTGATGGIHIQGWVRTNTGFVGNGTNLTALNASNITLGTLNIARIAASIPFLAGTNYVLTSIDGVNSWQDINAISPVIQGLNLPGGSGIFSQLNNNQYEFRSLTSTGFDITQSTNNINLESKAGVNIGSGSASFYADLSVNKLHQFRSIKSNNLVISQTSDLVNIDANITSDTLDITPNGIGIKIEVPATFEGTDYYVNGNYSGTEQLGTRSKPFKTLKVCLDKILNRNGSLPGTKDPNINGGNDYEKWDIRDGVAVRIIIQSYCETDENLAINNVTYFLEKGGYDSFIQVRSDAGVDAANLEWIIDMVPLVAAAPRYTSGPSAGQLINNINCTIEGNGVVGFQPGHNKRKGFFRAKGTNSYDFSGIPYPDSAVEQNDCNLVIGSVGGNIFCSMFPLTTLPSHISATVSIYEPSNSLSNDADTNIAYREGTDMVAYRTVSTPDYGCIQAEGRNSQFYESLTLNGIIVINAQEQHMIYAKDYGSIYSDNGRIYMRRNYQKVLVDGTLVSNPFRYVIVNTSRSVNGLSTSYASIGSYLTITTTGTGPWSTISVANSWRDQNGVAQTTPSGSAPLGWSFKYNGSLSSTGTAQVANCRKQYIPSKHVHDFYLRNGGSIVYGGDFYTQQNTGANHGGPDSFVCLENNITSSGTSLYPNRYGRSSTFCGFAANGGGFVTNLLYNQYIKTIYHPSYTVWSSHSVNLKGLKIDSYLTGINSADKTIGGFVTRIVNTSGSNWTNQHTIGNFKNCFFGDYVYFSPNTIRRPFSNMPIYTRSGSDVGKIYIDGTTIDLANAIMNPNIPEFSTPSAATASGLSSGCLYRETSTNIIKIIP